jgi:hypothetical protein
MAAIGAVWLRRKAASPVRVGHDGAACTWRQWTARYRSRASATRHDAWRAPELVFAAHCPDRITDLGRDRRSADTTARLPAPVKTKAAPMPALQNLGLEDDRGSERASLTGADRFRTKQCWQRNAISGSRAACHLNSLTSDPPSSFKKSIIPAASVPQVCPHSSATGPGLTASGGSRGETKTAPNAE